VTLTSKALPVSLFTAALALGFAKHFKEVMSEISVPLFRFAAAAFFQSGMSLTAFAMLETPGCPS
jgi:hypothetical protein